MPSGRTGLDGSVSPDPPRTLVLLRHGKSAYPPGVPDHRRPLADRGRRQASLAGEHLRNLMPGFDLVLCSTAERTRQTLAATGLAAGTTVDFRDEIYAAEADEILDIVSALPDSVHTLLVVGHFPGVADLAEAMAGPDSDRDALDRIGRKFPTSAFAIIHGTGRWSDLPHTARLVSFTVPRDHPEEDK